MRGPLLWCVALALAVIILLGLYAAGTGVWAMAIGPSTGGMEVYGVLIGLILAVLGVMGLAACIRGIRQMVPGGP